METKLPKKIPKFMYKYFWDTEPHRINPIHHTTYVIERIMNLGDPRAVKWMIKSVGKGEIAKTLSSRKGIDLTAAKFWSLVYDIPEENVLCLNKYYQEGQKKLWPY